MFDSGRELTHGESNGGTVETELQSPCARACPSYCIQGVREHTRVRAPSPHAAATAGGLHDALCARALDAYDRCARVRTHLGALRQVIVAPVGSITLRVQRASRKHTPPAALAHRQCTSARQARRTLRTPLMCIRLIVACTSANIWRVRVGCSECRLPHAML